MLATTLPFRNKTYSNYLHGHQNSIIHEQPPTLFQHILGQPLPFSRSHSRSEIRTTRPRSPPENGRYSDWGVIVVAFASPVRPHPSFLDLVPELHPVV